MSIVPPVCANESSKTGSTITVDVPGQKIWRLEEIQLSSIKGREAEWLNVCGASCVGGGPALVIVELPVIDELNLWFGRDAGWAGDVSTAKAEIQKYWGLLRDVIFWWEMASLIDILKKNEVLVKEVRVLENIVGEEPTTWTVFKEELTKLTSSVLASDEPATSWRNLTVRWSRFARRWLR